MLAANFVFIGPVPPLPSTASLTRGKEQGKHFTSQQGAGKQFTLLLLRVVSG